MSGTGSAVASAAPSRLVLWPLQAPVHLCVGAPECGRLSLPPFPPSRYQINARTELAIRYNDISPLENHHCAVAFQILAQPECNILCNVQPDGFKQIRQVCGVRAF